MEAKPKRKLRIWLLGVPVMLVLLFVAQMWGPNPRLRISRETTYITSPIRPDGFPDYEKYLLQQMSEGISPEENAAVLFWRAMWPGELSAEDEVPLAEALQMTLPDPQESLVSIYNNQTRDDLVKMLKGQEATPPAWDEFDRDSDFYEQAEELISQAMRRPWTSKQAPPLAKWAKENEKQLGWLVEGAARPKYYSPSPTLLNDSDEGLVVMLLPGAQMLRGAARSLTGRAMGHLGDGNIQEAWRHARACHQIARHTKSGTTLVEHLVGIAVDAMAAEATQTLLHHGDLSADEARQILADLQELSYMPSLLKPMNEGERLFYLDCASRLASGEWDLTDFHQMIYTGNTNETLGFVTTTRIDWNHVMKEGNQWYDRLAEAIRLPRAEQSKALKQITDEIDALGVATQPNMVAGSLVSHEARSRVVSDIMIRLFLPAVAPIAEASDRSDTIVDMTQLTAALAVFRAENGEYPESLSELVPDILPRIPQDIYSGKDLIYRKKDPGFLLYSVFRDGVDDGGTGLNGWVEKGEWLPKESSSRGRDADLVVLLPRPDFRIPEPAEAEPSDQ